MLAALEDGMRAADLESGTLDFKEDQSRRLRGEVIEAGATRHEPTARDIAEAACCFANSLGGVVVIGVDDRATGRDAFIGTDLDPNWLRHRIWELTEPRLAVQTELVPTSPHDRLMAVFVAPGLAAHKVAGGKYRHRVGTHCVEMTGPDHVVLANRYRDWSADPTAMTFTDVDPAALNVARQIMRASGEPGRVALASRPDEDLLRALGVLEPLNGTLTRTGALLFAVTDADRSHLDYMRRARPGGDALMRLDGPGRALLVEFADVESAIRLANQRVLGVRHGARGIVAAIPTAAAREAVVNAIMHRDWARPEPIVVEHLGDQAAGHLPGPFPPGVGEDNVLTTVSRPRNPHLANVMRSLRLAEREAVGVDRMYREMLLLGHRPPTIVEVADTVRCILIGGDPVEPVTKVTSLLSEDARSDVDVALVLYRLFDHPRTDAADLAPCLQKTAAEAAEALDRAERERLGDGGPLVVRAKASAPGFRLGEPARGMLAPRLPYFARAPRETVPFVAEILAAQGSIRSGDLVEYCGLKPMQASRVLTELRDSGVLAVGSAKAVGKGVFYVAGAR